MPMPSSYPKNGSAAGSIIHQDNCWHGHLINLIWFDRIFYGGNHGKFQRKGIGPPQGDLRNDFPLLILLFPVFNILQAKLTHKHKGPVERLVYN